MLKTTNKFIDFLRKDKIPSPTTRNFSQEQWRRDFESLGEGAVEASRVYEAGRWTGSILQKLWRDVADLGLERYGFVELVIAVMTQAATNYRDVQSSQDQGPSPLTVDHAFTSLGDSLWRTLALLATRQNVLIGDEVVPCNISQKLLEYCNQIYVLEYFMGRVVHCGWALELRDGKAEFSPSNEGFSENEAIGIAIRDEECMEFYQVYSNAWHDGKIYGEMPEHIRLIKRRGNRASFEVVKRPPERFHTTIAMFAMEFPDWLEPVLQQVPEELSGFSILQLIQGWLLIRQVFEEIYLWELEQRHSEGNPTCEIFVSDLMSIFEGRGLTEQQATHLISFLTYDWGRHESLWVRPLVRVGESILPFLPAILAPNLSRTLDLWLKNCTRRTINDKSESLIAFRGAVFEQHVRKAISGHIDSGSVVVDSFVLPTASKILGPDIDLLWRVGNTVYVGDVKFNKFPANPNEIGNYYREIEHGVEQVKVRAEMLQSRRPELARQLCWNGDAQNLIFRPLVITRHALGSGLSIHGVPCIQFEMLELLFDQNELFPFGTINRDGQITGETSLRYLKNPNEFESFLDFYINFPPYVRVRTHLLDTCRVIAATLPDQTEVSFEHCFIRQIAANELAVHGRELRDDWEKLLKVVTSPRRLPTV